jgi:hypothetical protein
MANYFNIIDESNFQILELINKYTIHKTQYFPIFGFSKISMNIKKEKELKERQENKLKHALKRINGNHLFSQHNSVEGIMGDENISASNKENAILWSIMKDRIPLKQVESYLREHPKKEDTPYRKQLCAYDYKRYGQDIAEQASS